MNILLTLLLSPVSVANAADTTPPTVGISAQLVSVTENSLVDTPLSVNFVLSEKSTLLIGFDASVGLMGPSGFDFAVGTNIAWRRYLTGKAARPFFQLGAGVTDLGVDDGVSVNSHAGFGADYFFNDSLSVGLATGLGFLLPFVEDGRIDIFTSNTGLIGSVYW